MKGEYNMIFRDGKVIGKPEDFMEFKWKYKDKLLELFKDENMGVFDADPMRKQETLELVKAYYKIANRIVAKKLFDLVISMSKSPYILNKEDDEE